MTILSGKGGVGKSSIAASLALTLRKNRKVVCADCDVDAANLGIVLGATGFRKVKELTRKKASFDNGKCNACRRCYGSCYFDAIEFGGKPKLKPFSCEGCYVCEMVCPKGAITMKDVVNATIGISETKYGFKVVSAKLLPGESGSGQVVSMVRYLAMKEGAEITLIDSAAGIGCPVIASVTGSDLVILVTEPTPSGLSDMRRAAEIASHFHVPYRIIINKHDMNPRICKKIEHFAEKNNADVIAKIQFDKAFAQALLRLTPIVEYKKEYVKIFDAIAKNILQTS